MILRGLFIGAAFIFVVECILFLIPFSFFDSLLRPNEDLPTSVIVAVLFHGYNREENGIDEETERRINYAISLLLNDEKIDKIILIGGNSPQFNLTGSSLMAKYCKDRGIDDGNIFIDNASFDSSTNIAVLEGFLDSNGLESAIVVSSVFHLLRIKYTQVNLSERIYYSPYNLKNSFPPVSRLEVWESLHYNGIIFCLKLVFPDKMYRAMVEWVRENTKY
jgi:vancomycin permeability regulator SanA